MEQMSRLHLHSVQVDARALSWEDYEAAYVYQNICRQLMKLAAKSDKDRRIDQVDIPMIKAHFIVFVAMRPL